MSDDVTELDNQVEALRRGVEDAERRLEKLEEHLLATLKALVDNAERQAVVNRAMANALEKLSHG